MKWRDAPWACPISFVIWGHLAVSSQFLRDKRPDLQSSLAPHRYLFFFRDTVIITAGTTTFGCVSYKKTSMFPWATWKLTPFFTPSDRPQTAVLGLLQHLWLQVFRRNLWDLSLQCRLLWKVILTALILGAGAEALHSWGHEQVKSR